MRGSVARGVGRWLRERRCGTAGEAPRESARLAIALVMIAAAVVTPAAGSEPSDVGFGEAVGIGPAEGRVQVVIPEGRYTSVDAKKPYRAKGVAHRSYGDAAEQRQFDVHTGLQEAAIEGVNGVWRDAIEQHPIVQRLVDSQGAAFQWLAQAPRRIRSKSRRCLTGGIDTHQLRYTDHALNLNRRQAGIDNFPVDGHASMSGRDQSGISQFQRGRIEAIELRNLGIDAGLRRVGGDAAGLDLVLQLDKRTAGVAQREEREHGQRPVGRSRDREPQPEAVPPPTWLLAPFAIAFCIGLGLLGVVGLFLTWPFHWPCGDRGTRLARAECAIDFGAFLLLVAAIGMFILTGFYGN